MVEIRAGDFRDRGRELADNSINLILTDPVYSNIEDYADLSRLAARVLKPNSACLVYCAIGMLPEVHDAMRSGGLTYRWRLITRPVHAKEFCGRLLICTQECLWYEKGNSKLYQSLFDCQMSTTKGSYDKDGANWGKGKDIIFRYVQTFTKPGDLVLDPFVGSGVVPLACKQLGRNFIGFDIDEDAVNRALNQVERAQPPLPNIFVEQPRLME